MSDLRELIRQRIGGVLAAFDQHEAGIYRAEDIGTEKDRFACGGACGFFGTEQEWLDHLAVVLADSLEAE